MPGSLFRDAPRPAVHCRYPILLLHGLFGFPTRRIGPLTLEYFRGVVGHLQSAGNRACTIGVHPWRSIDYRARQISRAIECDPDLSGQPLNLVGHSMGGLDARYLVSALGFSDRVKSITTIATPHRGSFLADLVCALPGVSRLFPAIPDLTRGSCHQFNISHPDAAEVACFSIPVATSLLACCPLLWPCWFALRLEGGDNDGQVTTASARWGEVLPEARGDHLQVIGMRYGLNFFHRESHLNLYSLITETLASRGY